MPDWLTALLAIYGAVVATLVAIFEIGRERRRDRPEIKVDVDVGTIGNPAAWTEVVIARARNTGLRDVELRSCQFIVSGGKAFQPAHLPELPAVLKPTQSVDAWLAIDDLAHLLMTESEELGRKARLEGATFKNGTGRRYRGWTTKRLRAHLREKGIQ